MTQNQKDTLLVAGFLLFVAAMVFMVLIAFDSVVQLHDNRQMDFYEEAK